MPSRAQPSRTKQLDEADLAKTKEDIEGVLDLFKAFVATNRPQVNIDEIATCKALRVARGRHAAAEHTTCTASDESSGHRTAVCVHGWFRRLAEATRHHMSRRERGATDRTALPRS